VYEECCAPRHTAARPAETALALMRSRYSAFTRGDGPYLVATCARLPRPGEAEALGAWGRSVGWVGLTVEAVEGGGPGDADGVVQFTARFVEAGALVALSERSRFARADGRWRYLEGEARAQRQKLGRNEPCPCGSGLKVKQCHA
jgi:SEC-C motif-containing protein